MYIYRQYNTPSNVLNWLPVQGLPTNCMSVSQSLFSVRNHVRMVECVWASTGAAVPKDLLEVSVKQVRLFACCMHELHFFASVLL